MQLLADITSHNQHHPVEVQQQFKYGAPMQTETETHLLMDRHSSPNMINAPNRCSIYYWFEAKCQSKQAVGIHTNRLTVRILILQHTVRRARYSGCRKSGHGYRRNGWRITKKPIGAQKNWWNIWASLQQLRLPLKRWDTAQLLQPCVSIIR